MRKLIVTLILLCSSTPSFPFSIGVHSQPSDPDPNQYHEYLVRLSKAQPAFYARNFNKLIEEYTRIVAAQQARSSGPERPMWSQPLTRSQPVMSRPSQFVPRNPVQIPPVTEIPRTNPRNSSRFLAQQLPPSPPVTPDYGLRKRDQFIRQLEPLPSVTNGKPMTLEDCWVQGSQHGFLLTKPEECLSSILPTSLQQVENQTTCSAMYQRGCGFGLNAKFCNVGMSRSLSNEAGPCSDISITEDLANIGFQCCMACESGKLAADLGMCDSHEEIDLVGLSFSRCCRFAETNKKNRPSSVASLGEILIDTAPVSSTNKPLDPSSSTPPESTTSTKLPETTPTSEMPSSTTVTATTTTTTETSAPSTTVSSSTFSELTTLSTPMEEATPSPRPTATTTEVTISFLGSPSETREALVYNQPSLIPVPVSSFTAATEATTAKVMSYRDLCKEDPCFQDPDDPRDQHYCLNFVDIRNCIDKVPEGYKLSNTANNILIRLDQAVSPKYLEFREISYPISPDGQKLDKIKLYSLDVKQYELECELDVANPPLEVRHEIPSFRLTEPEEGRYIVEMDSGDEIVGPGAVDLTIKCKKDGRDHYWNRVLLTIKPRNA